MIYYVCAMMKQLMDKLTAEARRKFKLCLLSECSSMVLKKWELCSLEILMHFAICKTPVRLETCSQECAT